MTSLADKVIVLDHGEKIAEGTPDEVRTERGSAARLSRPECTPNRLKCPMLEFQDVDTYYGDLHVLKKVELHDRRRRDRLAARRQRLRQIDHDEDHHGHRAADAAAACCSTGRRSASCSTAERVRRGIAPVLEARRLFPRMTVFENLEMGAYTRKRGPEFDEDLERVYSLFPRVKERRTQICRHALGRRAADGGDRPRADGAPQA